MDTEISHSTVIFQFCPRSYDLSMNESLLYIIHILIEY